MAFARDLYSSSVLDQNPVGCFLALHDMRFFPKNMANPPVDRLSSIHPAQSASEKALIKVDEDILKVSPVVQVSLIYRNIRLTAVQ